MASLEPVASGTGETGTDPETTAGPSGGSSTGTYTGTVPDSPGAVEYDPDGKSWFTGPPETAVPEQSDPDLGPDEPGETTGVAVALDYDPEAPPPEGDVKLADPESTMDPCALVPLREWQSWVGTADASSQEVSAGEECQYLEPADSARMSVAYYRGGQSTTYLSSERKKSATPEADIGSPAYWMPAHPAPFASTMVVECPGGDLVITIFARADPHPAADIHQAAQRWAQLAAMAVTG